MLPLEVCCTRHTLMCWFLELAMCMDLPSYSGLFLQQPLLCKLLRHVCVPLGKK